MRRYGIGDSLPIYQNVDPFLIFCLLYVRDYSRSWGIHAAPPEAIGDPGLAKSQFLKYVEQIRG